LADAVVLEVALMAGKVSSDPNVFLLPDIGEGLTEAELIRWLVKPGDKIEATDALAEVETDKALSEVTSPRSGVIKSLHGEAGTTVLVGEPFVTFEGEAGSSGGSGGGGKPAAAASSNNGSAKATTGAASSAGDESKPREDDGTVVGKMTGSLSAVAASEGKALATPAVRRLARDLGVDINGIKGTGLAGRVTERDVRSAAESGTAAKSSAAPATAARSPGAGHSPTPVHSSSTPSAMPSTQHPPAASAYPGGFAGQGYMQQPQMQMPQQPMPMPAQMPSQYPSQMQGGMPGYGMPPAYLMIPTPMGYMPVPMPMPMGMGGMGMGGMGMPGWGGGWGAWGMPGMMPGGGGGGGGGVPVSPGFVASVDRPIPDPAQKTSIQPGQASAEVPFRGVRRTIANRLRESVSTAVHFTVVDEADVTALDAYRRELSTRTGQKLTFLPFVCAAVSRALAGRFGALNATVDDAGERIIQHAGVHLGIATDTDSGLMVPVIREAHAMGVPQLATAISSAAAGARDRTAPREALMGSTFTISNVGSHAGRFATPVINYPEVAILAVGKAYDGVVVRNGQAVVAKVMPLSLACDHRVVDGATAALALAEIVRSLQEPTGLA